MRTRRFGELRPVPCPLFPIPCRAVFPGREVHISQFEELPK